MFVKFWPTFSGQEFNRPFHHCPPLFSEEEQIWHAFLSRRLVLFKFHSKPINFVSFKAKFAQELQSNAFNSLFEMEKVNIYKLLNTRFYLFLTDSLSAKFDFFPKLRSLKLLTIPNSFTEDSYLIFNFWFLVLATLSQLEDVSVFLSAMLTILYVYNVMLLSATEDTACD